MAGAPPGQMKLTLQILVGDLELTQRHIGGAVAEQLPVSRWKAHPLSRLERSGHLGRELYQLLQPRAPRHGRAGRAKLRAPLHGSGNAASIGWAAPAPTHSVNWALPRPRDRNMASYDALEQWVENDAAPAATVAAKYVDENSAKRGPHERVTPTTTPTSTGSRTGLRACPSPHPLKLLYPALRAQLHLLHSRQWTQGDHYHGYQ